MRFHCYILFLLLQVRVLLTDHYKGGSISWRPTAPYTLSGTVEIMITQRHSWTLTRYACDDTTINTMGTYNDTQNATKASITCISSAADCTASFFTTINSILYCTDYSTEFDISTGTYSSKQNLALNSIIDIASRGASWANVTLTNDWSLVSHMDLTPISGKINSSPVTGSLPVIQVYFNEIRVIQILAADWDSDQVIRCRWSYQSSTDECGSTCFNLPNAVLSPIDCAITWTGVLRAEDIASGLIESTYVVAITVEDFVNASSTTPLSSVPHQLLVHVSYKPVNACATKPTIVGGFSARNLACYAYTVGVSYILRFLAMVHCSNNSIIDFVSTTPYNVFKTEIYESSNTTWGVNVTWIPLSDQIGLQPLCLAAVDDYGQTSDQYCIMILVGGSNPSFYYPTFVQSTASPVGTVLSTQTVFSIQANLELRRSKLDNTFIYIYRLGGGLFRSLDCKYSPDVYYINKTLIFFIQNPTWTLGATYYVILGAGAATAAQYCGPEAGSVNLNRYWRFTIWNPQMSSTTTPSTTTTPATTHTVTTRFQGTTTYNTLFTTTGVPAYTKTATTTTTSTTSTSATTTTTTSATTSTTSTTTTTEYIPNANVIYPKDYENSCTQPAAIIAAIVTSIMIPVHFLGMINLFVKMNNLHHKGVLRAQMIRHKYFQKASVFQREQESLL